MGDRANILIKERTTDSGIYLYTHWRGTELPKTLQRALRKKWRWDDPPYLTRIIFSEMIDGEEKEETGFGISTRETDGMNRVLTVNCENLLISFNEKIWTFHQYIALSEEEIKTVWD
jgi:hypothetical protein